MTSTDLNRDGKPDLLFTNGDALDYMGLAGRPWFGIQWLENRGEGVFQFHRIGDMPGAFGPNAADLNGDGYPDVVAVSPFADWNKPDAVSLMAWINDGQQAFTPVVLAHKPTHLITAAVGDLDGDGVPEIVTGGFHAFPPFENMSSITLWRRKDAVIATTRGASAPPVVTPLQREVGRLLDQAAAQPAADPQSVDALAVRGRIYHANGFIKEARSCWAALHSRQPAEAKWCYYLADLSRLGADETGLRSWLEQTVQLAPDYAPAWLELAELEFKAGHLDGAERAYRARDKLVPGDPYAGLGLARVALQQDRRAEGKRLIEDLIKRVPEFPSSHNLYAEFLAQEGDQAG
ncbi:MAG: FG-GAP-like repeat-containing protein, partial [Oleiharenicola lentus]